jgi:hypothetical protein
MLEILMVQKRTFTAHVRASIAFEGLGTRLARRALLLGVGGAQARQLLLRAGLKVAGERSERELRDLLARAEPYRRRAGEPLVYISFHQLTGEPAEAAEVLRQRLAAAGAQEASDPHVVAFVALDELEDGAFRAAAEASTLHQGRARTGDHPLVRYIHPDERGFLDELKETESRQAVFERAFETLGKLSDAELKTLSERLPRIPVNGHVRLATVSPRSAEGDAVANITRRLEKQLVPVNVSTPWRLAIRVVAEAEGLVR